MIRITALSILLTVFCLAGCKKKDTSSQEVIKVDRKMQSLKDLSQE